MQLFRYISLFSGGFGFDLGLEQASTEQAAFQVATCLDNSAAARATIKFNRPKVCIIGDGPDEAAGDLCHLTTTFILERAGLESQNVDLVVGGPPCQSWSILGKREGFNDPRGDLMLQFVRVVREAQPRAFILENVSGFYSYAGGSALNTCCSLFRAAGYTALTTWILNAVDYGVPQYRSRVFIIGFRNDLQVAPNLPAPPRTHRPRSTLAGALLPGITDEQPFYRTVGEALRDIPDTTPNHVPRIHGDRVRMRYEQLAQGARDITDHTDRLRTDEPSGTVLVGSSKGGGRPFIHPEHPRHLTVREAARLQDFPDTWEFRGKGTAQYRQVGNAVPPGLAAVVGRYVNRVLVEHLGRTTHDMSASERTIPELSTRSLMGVPNSVAMPRLQNSVSVD